MPFKGITSEDEIIIKSILEPYKEKCDFYYYGSRIKGDFRFLSDLDIMIKSHENTTDNNIINDLKYKFDNSKLSYVVNITDFYNLDENFYKLIENDLQKVNFLENL